MTNQNMSTILKDSHFREMNEIEVIYLKKGFYESRKFAYYLKEEADKVYQRTVNKFRDVGNVLIIQRDENGTLIKNTRF